MRSLSAILAFAFVVHSGYVNATVMECYSSGKSEVSLGEKDFCCASYATPFESVSAKCCGFEKSEKKFDGSQAQLEFEIQIQPVAFTEYQYDLFSLISANLPDEISLKSPPLLPGGYDLLKLISVFRL